MEKKDENAGDRAREKDVTWLNAREIHKQMRTYWP